MNMKQLKYVSVLSEHSNFTRAAEALGISQPSLSQYIKNIEKQLGTQLFIRAGQDVRLTDAGKAYLQIGREILMLENEMESRLHDIIQDKTGTITVGIAPYRCISIMPAVVKTFHERYPGIKVVLTEQKTAQLKESAEKGKLDLCISTLPIDEKLFDYHRVMYEETVLSVPKEYGKAMNAVPYGEVEFSDFASLPFIALPPNQVMGAAVYEMFEKTGVEPNIAVECQSLSAVAAMAAEGIGAALLPYSLAKKNESKKANYYLLKDKLKRREIVVFYRKDRYLSGPMQAMIDILKSFCDETE